MKSYEQDLPEWMLTSKDVGYRCRDGRVYFEFYGTQFATIGDCVVHLFWLYVPDMEVYNDGSFSVMNIPYRFPTSFQEYSELLLQFRNKWIVLDGRLYYNAQFVGYLHPSKDIVGLYKYGLQYGPMPKTEQELRTIANSFFLDIPPSMVDLSVPLEGWVNSTCSW